MKRRKGSNDEMKHIRDIGVEMCLQDKIRLKPSPSGYPDFFYLPQVYE